MAGALVRILGIVQGFGYGRGRATTAVELLTPLAAAGHDVDVFMTSGSPAAREVGGVLVQRFRDYDPAVPYDVVVYNSGLGPRPRDVVRRCGAARLMCQHSYDASDAGLRLADKVWFPSRAAMRADTGRRYQRFVSPPPINPDLYRTTTGDQIALSLSSPHKGGILAAHLARSLPRHEFLVVKDPRGHGVSLFKGLKNVELVDFMQPREFFSRARVQLFPSRSETYGRVAVEGAVSGIPLVASKHPGIREAMAGHGIFLDRANTRQWVATVDRLMTDRAYWRRASHDVERRAEKIRYRADQSVFRKQVEAMGR